LIAIPIAILGFVQSAAGPDSFVNVYASYSEDAAVATRFGEDYSLARTSGTFSYISGYTAYLTIMSFLALGYNIAQGWRVRNNVLPLAALALVVGAMFTTGSRAPVFILIAAAPVIFLWAMMARVLTSAVAVRLFLLLPLLAVAAVNISSGAFEAFVQRAGEANDSAGGRLLSLVSETAEALSNAPVLGTGIGTTHPSAMAIMGTEWPWWLENRLVTEVEPARVSVELGLIGLVLVGGLRLAVAVFAFRCVSSFQNPAYRALGIVLAVHLALGLINSITLNVTASLYYWGALGLLLTMRRLEQVARREANTAATAIQTRLRPSASVGV
jgi:hypothetical protein